MFINICNHSLLCWLWVPSLHPFNPPCPPSTPQTLLFIVPDAALLPIHHHFSLLATQLHLVLTERLFQLSGWMVDGFDGCKARTACSLVEARTDVTRPTNHKQLDLLLRHMYVVHVEQSARLRIFLNRLSKISIYPDRKFTRWVEVAWYKLLIRLTI